MTFYRCEHCGNIIAHIQDSGVRCHCCGEEMKPLTPNTTDAAGEQYRKEHLEIPIPCLVTEHLHHFGLP